MSAPHETVAMRGRHAKSSASETSECCFGEAEGQTRRIRLGCCFAAIIDAADFDLVNNYGWSLEPSRHTYYAVAYLDPTDASRCVRMHRLIASASGGEVVDHINGNGLDNRRENLRICSTAENGKNRRKQKTRAVTASRFKGVSWDKTNRKWRARIVVNGKQKSLGNFRSQEEAARAYDAAAREHFGVFACTNEDMGLYDAAALGNSCRGP